MKKLLLLSLFFCFYILKAQDLEPGQQKFYLFGNSLNKIYLSPDSAYFKQRRFFLCWEWDLMTKHKINSSLDVLGHDIDYKAYASNLLINSDLLVKNEIYTHYPDPGIINVRGFQYEPTLQLDPNEPDKFVQRQNDTTHPVFGFLERRGRLDPYTAPNFNRLIIDSSWLVNQVILDNPWPNDQLIFDYHDSTYYTYDTVKGHIDSTKHITEWVGADNDYMCRQMFISINLRRFWDNTMTGDNILKIELPDTLLDGTSGYIQFNKIPDNRTDSTFSLSNGRGLIRKLIDVGPGIRAFYITRNMLPPFSQDKDITISAYFICDNNPNGFNNHHLNWKDTTDMNPIHKVGIRITYLVPNCPLAIDWVRFETPHAQSFLRGNFDSTMLAVTQRDLTRFTTDSFPTQNIKLFRFKLGTDFGMMQYWMGLKYFNKLIGNISTCVDGFPYPLHYNEYVNPPDRSLSAFNIIPYVSAPFSRKAYADTLWAKYDTKYLSIRNGYTGLKGDSNLQHNELIENDSTKTHYETYLVNGFFPLPITYFLENPNDSIYSSVMNSSNNNWRASFLAHWEGKLYFNFLAKNMQGLIYLNKAWWAENYTLTCWADNVPSYPDIQNKYSTCLRPYTGEELRLATMTPVILGAKGLIYDGPSTFISDPRFTRMYDNNCHGNTWLDTLESWPDKRFLESDSTGPDFIRGDTLEVVNLHTRLQPLDTIAKWTDRPSNKIYMGRKSQRLEMKKIHDWAWAVGDTLLKLHLITWYAKGYKIWNTHDPLYPDNIISKFVYTDGIRTKHPFADSYEGTHVWFFRDSSFYDITILKDSVDNLFPNQNPLNHVFYMGVQNRRTNPLIQPLDVINNGEHSYTDSALLFYTTAEFDYNMHHNNGCIIPFQDSTTSKRDSTYWQNLWWRRYGCREITIPMKYTYDSTQNPNELVLRIRELGAETYLDTNWYRRAPFYHKIDTVMWNNDTLKMKMLPGEGKMLKVDVSDIAGNPTDTCYGCQKITQNISIQLNSGSCNYGMKCNSYKIKNNSDCNYDSLNLVAEFTASNPDSMEFNLPYGWYVTKKVADGKNYALFHGSLSELNWEIFDLCYPITDSFNLKFKIGKVIDGKFFACDSILDSLNFNGFGCNKVNVNLVANFTKICACNECSYNLVSNQIDSCFANSWSIRFLSPGKPDSTVNGNGFNGQGIINDSFCIKDGIDSVVIDLMWYSSVVCSKGITVSCHKCDSIKIVNISPNYDDILSCLKTVCCYGCVVKYYIILNNLKNCIKKFDFIEVTSHGDILLDSNIMTNGQDTILRNYCYCGDAKYRYVFKDSSGNEICEDSIVHPYCRCTAITTIVNLTNPHPFCCGGITIFKTDSTIPPVYAIGIAEPAYPDQFVYFERRDSNQIPFNLDYPGYYVTDLCVPEDSLLSFNVYCWDIDTNLVAAAHYEGSCQSEKLNTQMYIDKFDAYPNPANSSITFAYTLLQPANVQLQLYDDMGNLISTIFKGKQGKGSYKRQYSTYNLKEGLYYGVLWANTEYKTIGIIILH